MGQLWVKMSRIQHWLTTIQPRPLAAIDLIHKQPVRWTEKRIVSCDGGGGPLGHPRIFINTDRPQICACTYCGVPYVSTCPRHDRVSCNSANNNNQAHEHHRKHLESLPSTSYPLEPPSDPATIPASDMETLNAKTGSTEPYQSATGKPLEQR